MKGTRSTMGSKSAMGKQTNASVASPAKPTSSMHFAPSLVMGTRAPSFNEADVVTPTEGEIGEILKSVAATEGGEEEEKPYHYLEPLDRRTAWQKVPYKPLLYSNMFLTFFLLLLWAFWCGLFYKFHAILLEEAEYVLATTSLPKTTIAE